jgi:hypothetical protein
MNQLSWQPDTLSQSFLWMWFPRKGRIGGPETTLILDREVGEPPAITAQCSQCCARELCGMTSVKTQLEARFRNPTQKQFTQKRGLIRRLTLRRVKDGWYWGHWDSNFSGTQFSFLSVSTLLLCCQYRSLRAVVTDSSWVQHLLLLPPGNKSLCPDLATEIAGNNLDWLILDRSPYRNQLTRSRAVEWHKEKFLIKDS